MVRHFPKNESTTTRVILRTASSYRDGSRRSQKFSSLARVTLWIFFKGVDGQTTRRAASNETTHSHNYGKTETREAVEMRRYRRQRIMNCSADGALLDESKGFEVQESKEPGWTEMGHISFLFFLSLFRFLLSKLWVYVTSRFRSKCMA